MGLHFGLFSMVANSALLAAADEHIVIPPLAAAAGAAAEEKMLVFMPGGAVPNTNYVATAAAIQVAVGSQVRLWMVIPAVFERLCILSCTSSLLGLCAPLHASVEAALSMAQGKGWTRGNDSEDLWIAGHSLGGVCSNTLFQAYHTKSSIPYAGLIVMGSYVDESGSYDLTNFPKPLLTLNAELDGGLARPGKTAIWYRQHLELDASKKTDKPVIILPKLNHSNFCPGFDVPGDLYAEVDQSEATKLIGEVVAAFLNLHFLASKSKWEEAQILLNEKLDWTREIMTPYLAAQDMERTAAVTEVSPEGSSPWCSQAQTIVANLPKELDDRLGLLDGFHVSPPELMHCHPSYSAAPGSKLVVTTCSHTDYYSDVSNTGSISAAKQVACKMLTRERILQQLNASADSATATTCRDVNLHALSVAQKLAMPQTLQRFETKGRPFCFLDDSMVTGNIGPLWVYQSSLSLTDSAKCLQVVSPAIVVPLTSSIYPGNHFCKVLSPARALDWMMSDSLKPAKSQEVSTLIV